MTLEVPLKLRFRVTVSCIASLIKNLSKFYIFFPPIYTGRTSFVLFLHFCYTYIDFIYRTRSARRVRNVNNCKEFHPSSSERKKKKHIKIEEADYNRRQLRITQLYCTLLEISSYRLNLGRWQFLCIINSFLFFFKDWDANTSFV